MIKLNDILKLDKESLDIAKIRLNLQFAGNNNPIEFFKSRQNHTDYQVMIDGNYYNYNRNKSYQLGNIVIGFIRLPKGYGDDLYLLFHIGKVTKDLNVFNGVGYEFEELSCYKKYCGRLIIRFKNQAQNMIRKASSIIDECEVVEILSSEFDDDIFPGYDNIFISWYQLERVISKPSWRTALINQKGIYLISDTYSGKFYVGSAYGKDMLLGRWEQYVKRKNGGNIEFKKLDDEYIKKNFHYSILEVFKSTIDDNVIIQRENYWKKILLTRKFGYNLN